MTGHGGRTEQESGQRGRLPDDGGDGSRWWEHGADPADAGQVPGHGPVGSTVA